MPRLLVVFAVGGEEYALPVENVREVVPAAAARRIPSADALLEGVLGLRGALVPLYDLAARLGAPGPPGASPPSGEGQIVIVETGALTFGSRVDAVREVLSAEEEDLAPLPAGSDPALAAIIHAAGRLVVLLAAHRLFPER